MENRTGKTAERKITHIKDVFGLDEDDFQRKPESDDIWAEDSDGNGDEPSVTHSETFDVYFANAPLAGAKSGLPSQPSGPAPKPFTPMGMSSALTGRSLSPTGRLSRPKGPPSSPTGIPSSPTVMPSVGKFSKPTAPPSAPTVKSNEPIGIATPPSILGVPSFPTNKKRPAPKPPATHGNVTPGKPLVNGDGESHANSPGNDIGHLGHKRHDHVSNAFNDWDVSSQTQHSYIHRNSVDLNIDDGSSPGDGHGEGVKLDITGFVSSFQAGITNTKKNPLRGLDADTLDFNNADHSMNGLELSSSGVDTDECSTPVDTVTTTLQETFTSVLEKRKDDGHDLYGYAHKMPADTTHGETKTLNGFAITEHTYGYTNDLDVVKNHKLEALRDGDGDDGFEEDECVMEFGEEDDNVATQSKYTVVYQEYHGEDFAKYLEDDTCPPNDGGSKSLKNKTNKRQKKRKGAKPPMSTTSSTSMSSYENTTKKGFKQKISQVFNQRTSPRSPTKDKLSPRGLQSFTFSDSKIGTSVSDRDIDDPVFNRNGHNSNNEIPSTTPSKRWWNKDTMSAISVNGNDDIMMKAKKNQPVPNVHHDVTSRTATSHVGAVEQADNGQFEDFESYRKTKMYDSKGRALKDKKSNNIWKKLSRSLKSQDGKKYAPQDNTVINPLSKEQYGDVAL